MADDWVTINPPNDKGWVTVNPPAPKSQRSPVDMTDFAVQGATFGLGDEAGAAGAASGRFLRALGADVLAGRTPDIDKAWSDAAGRYQERLTEQREGLKAYRDENPIKAIGAEVLGGVAAMPTIAGAAGNLVARLPKWLQATGLGGLFGAAQGAGTAEGGAGERAAAGGVGGAIGAATGGLAYGAVKGIEAGISGARNLYRSAAHPREQALRIVAQKMGQDQVLPHQAQQRIRDLGPQAIIADVGGENTLGLARGAAGVPGATKDRAARVLNRRAETEATRIGEAVNRGLKPQDYFAAEDEMLATLRAGAQKAYTAAYEGNPSIMTPKLNRILQSRDARRALGEASHIVENLRASGQPNAFLGPIDDELTAMARYAADLGKMERVAQPGVAKGFSLETWDTLKRGIDALMEGPRFTNELTGRLNRQGAALNQLRQALLSELDRATGGKQSLYSAARAQYAGDAEVLGALRDGRKFMRLDPEQITRQMGELSDAAKEAYRSGAARAVKDIVENVADQASASNRLFGKAITRAKIKAIFPDDPAFADFAKTIEAERLFAKTKNTVGAGSRTAPMQAEQADALNLLGSVGAVAGANVPGVHQLVASGIGRRIMQKMVGPRPEVDAKLARILFTRNQPENLRVLDAIEALRQSGRAGGSSPAVEALARALVAGQGQQEGRFLADRLNQNQRP